jgi:hypothetical protein
VTRSALFHRGQSGARECSGARRLIRIASSSASSLTSARSSGIPTPALATSTCTGSARSSNSRTSQLGQVGDKAPRRRTELGDQALEIRFTSARDRESTTPRRQFASDRPTDACGGAGNENGSTFESHAQHPDPLVHCSFTRNVRP